MEYKALYSKKHNLFGICKHCALFFGAILAVWTKRKPDGAPPALYA